MKHAGIYLHIPFCRSRCSYCDFATGMYESALAEKYVCAVAKEIREWHEVEPENVDTIYFGGGTPSLLSPAQVQQILDAVHSRFNVIGGAEVTLEMNPANITQENHRRDAEGAEIAQRPANGDTRELSSQKLQDFHRLGINRASFGAQTFDDDQLRRLGRTHTSDDIRTTFRHLREAGFDNINFDLIAGLPGQTLDGWSHNIEEALALHPEHLSLYLLDVHEGTPLADQIKRGMHATPDDDLAAEMYRIMVAKVCKAGYEHYEISNFSLPGYESRHNTKYWTGAPYYGFGCSAHSYDGRFRRWSNERDAARYTQAIERGRSPIVERVHLNEDDAKAEAVFLGLRMMRGVDLRQYRDLFGADLKEEHRDDLLRLSTAGLIEIEGDVIKLTQTGALLSNEVFAAFV